MGTIAPVILEELVEESRKWEQRITKEEKKEDTSNGTVNDNQENGKVSQENGKSNEAVDVNNKGGSPVPGRKINGAGKEKKLRCEEDPDCIDYDYRYSNLVQAAADYED